MSPGVGTEEHADRLLAYGVADPALREAVVLGLADVEAAVHDAVRSADPLADDAAGHLVRAGGKRTRPLLCLLAAELGTPGPLVVDAAVVVELTHLATLYHDDVIDSATVRRGVPAAQEVWGNTVAILTGDLLFARASVIGARLGPAAVSIQARTFERLVLGEMRETVGPRDGEDPVAHYLQVLSDKTGSLIATSARFGGMFSGLDEATQDVLVRYGDKVGVAFQLADDVLDLAADRADSGKTPGTDLREHVPTLPVLLLRRAVSAGEAPAGSGDLLDTLDGDLTDDAVLADTVARLREHPVTGEARAEARRWAADAVDALAPLPVSPARDALAAVAEALADRTG
ncbi:polyprenyl synthetase family protein [Aquipuribacter nitratireducens]|uniref:Polyprenyl synthetase family protein n=1 Tax=Aquipuribacter nitratireducens TaxID=650104 RepID=A0ABW0GLP6_9MICO